MKIDWHNEKRHIRELVPYVANPRQITDKQAKDLKASLDKFGIADPIVINTDNTIIGGHQRKKILESLMGVDPDFEIDVRVPDRELTIDEARELNVRLNKNMGQWDFDVLANNFELDDLLEWGFERTDLDLDLWMNDPPDDAEPQIDRAEELRELWGVETGQLWQLGEHRLICGDCTDKAVVERVMGGERADITLNDPPYGMAAVKNSGVLKEKYNDIVGDETNELAIKAYEIVKRMSVPLQVFWGANYYSSNLPDASCWLVWDKNNGDSDQMDCELAWTNFDGVTRQFTRASERGGGRLHPTQKPVQLYEWIIEKFCNNGIIVSDLFLGSGTTLIACERLNRKCRAVEISPAYVAVAIQRWVDVTGGVPELVG